MKPVRNLFIEKVNNKFRAVTKTDQVTGLSVCIDMIVHHVKDSVKIVVNDFRQIEMAINRFKPKNLILGYNFLNVSEIKALRSRYPFLKVYMIMHSPASFMAVDASSLRSLYDATENGCKVIVNDPRLDIGMNNVIHLENCYKINYQERVEPSYDSGLNVICSGSVRVLKNHLTQAMAAIHYADSEKLNLNFYCNLGRGELSGAVISSLRMLFTKNPKHKLISLPWQKHGEFVKSLSRYHIGMQVSFTESYNIVSADYINAGLSMVVSPEIRFASDSVKCQPNEILKMSDLMLNAHLYVSDSREKFKIHNEKAVRMWNQELN